MGASIADLDLAVGVPFWRRASFMIAQAAVVYTLFALAIVLWVLPVPFRLSGTELLLAQTAVIVAGIGLMLYVALMARRSASRGAAIRQLAASRGWRLEHDVSSRPWGGSIDEQIERNGRYTREYLDARGDEHPFETATRTFTVGSGQGATLVTCRAVKIPLGSELPRMTLRSRSGGGVLGQLPKRSRGTNVLRLEGNFSDLFELSVPSGYERDALYLLTPDLMVVLLDNVADLDLETVDSTLHVYLPADDLSRPDALRRLLTVVAVLDDRFGLRARRYRDDRAEPIDPERYRVSGDTLHADAQSIRSRHSLRPILTAVLAPAITLASGVLLLSVLS